MKPETIGRVLGVGLRIAGRMAGQRLAGSAQAGADRTADRSVGRPVTIDAATGSIAGRVSPRAAGRATAGVARGIGGFFRPFRRVGGSIFLEVVGVFFLLFVVVFGNWAWRLRAEAVQGPEHAKFLVYAGMMLLFLYLTVSSFWRARRK